MPRMGLQIVAVLATRNTDRRFTSQKLVRTWKLLLWMVHLPSRKAASMRSRHGKTYNVGREFCPCTSRLNRFGQTCEMIVIGLCPRVRIPHTPPQQTTLPVAGPRATAISTISAAFHGCSHSDLILAFEFVGTSTHIAKMPRAPDGRKGDARNYEHAACRFCQSRSPVHLALIELAEKMPRKRFSEPPTCMRRLH